MTGKNGIAVMLYDPKKGSVNRIERESGVKFEHLSAPQPADVAKAAGVEAAESITQISDRYIYILYRIQVPIKTEMPYSFWIFPLKDIKHVLLSSYKIALYFSNQCDSSFQGCC